MHRYLFKNSPSVFFFEDLSERGVAGLYHNSILSFLRKCHAAFRSGCTILHSHHQSMRVQFQFCCRLANICYFLDFFIIIIIFYSSHPGRCQVTPLLLSLVFNFPSGRSVGIFDLFRSRVHLDSVYFWIQTLELSVGSSSEQSSDQTAQGFYPSIW